jgi:lysophospholipase L1-like esterase
MSAAVLAIALALTGSACHGRLCDAKALDPYFAALETAKAKGHAPVHVLQIGDSHSAGDNITGARREALQTRFGSGGRGVLPPGRPFEGFVPHEVTVEQSDGWVLQTTMSAAAQDPATRPLFGISGYRLTSQQPGASISMTAEPSAAFTRVTVCAERAPGAGAFVLSFGATTTRVPLAADKASIGCTTVQATEPQTYASVATEAGPVTVTSWAAFDDDGGAVVSNLGVIGSQLRHFAETDDAAVTEELKAYRPDLIILAYGTNEGFGEVDPVSYASLLEGQLERLKRLSGGVPILVMGAPEAEKKRPEPPQPRRRGRHFHRKPFYPWETPPGLAEVRAVQRKVAHEEGVAFWDWAMGMGGKGAAKRWSSADPPLMRPDHVHFTAAGGAEIAKALDADLEAAAKAWARER